MASSWMANKSYSDPEKWICIYPAYVNSKKSIKEGRRISKDKAVENPTYQEIRDVLAAAGLKVGVENKEYPRERSKEMLYKGRIRVQLKNDDGTLYNEAFDSRKSVMLHLGANIPKLKTRVNKTVGGDQSQAQSSTSGKKKGKGRK